MSDNPPELILKTVSLPPKTSVTVDIGSGYVLTSNEMLYQILPGSDMELSFGRKFHLISQGKNIHDFVQQDAGKSDAIKMALGYRRNLFKSIDAVLREREEPSKVAWIQKRFVREPADVPPWERTDPARTIVTTLNDVDWGSLNDEGNALRFELECSGYLIYNLDTKLWNAWTGTYWCEADTQLVLSERFVASTIARELKPFEQQLVTMQAAGCARDAITDCKDWVTAVRNHVNYSKKESNMKAMASLCAQSTMAVHMTGLSNAALMACKNGVIDTKKGKFYPLWEAEQFKYQYPDRYVDCTYTPGAKPELFLQHLHTIFEDNTTPDLPEHVSAWNEQDSVNCFKRLLGYLLVAGNPEQLFIFLWGAGANGKSTTFDVLREVLGGEVAEASAKELYATKEEKAATGIAKGLRRRVLLFSELSDEDSNASSAGKVSTSIIKNITGDRKTAAFRVIYGAGSVQDIICTPVALTNDLPHFDKELDDALLRRLVTVPHRHVFKEEERDHGIVEKLLAEKDAIFSLMVDEMIAYREDGLVPFPEHWKAGQAQLLAGDAMFTFISEYYQKTDGSSPEKRIAFKIIEGDYIPWCRQNMIECSTTMRIVGENQYGEEVRGERLSTGESRKIHKAFKAMGFIEKQYGGCPCIWGERRRC